jgi:hypothetical protein
MQNRKFSSVAADASMPLSCGVLHVTFGGGGTEYLEDYG